MRLIYPLLLILALVACGNPPRMVVIDGRDSTGVIITPINLWNDYSTRNRVVGRVNHGDTVSLLQRDGNGCEVRTTTGTTGWLTCANFIREFK